jgi:hypothetical protein
MGGYFIRINGENKGPFTKEQILELCQAHDLPSTTLTWREGEKRWVPLFRRWRVGSKVGQQVLRLALLTSIVSILSSAVLLLLGVLPGTWMLTHAPVKLAFFVVAVLLISGTLTGIYLVTERKRVGHVTLGSVFCSVILVMSASFLIVTNIQTFHIEEIMADDDDAEISYDPDRSAIMIEGYIGPRFLSDMRQALDRNPSARTVIITSPGGLIDDAVQAADWIRERNLVIRIDGECASACVFMWTAAPNREATPGALLGFHQTRIDGIVSELATKLNLDATEKEADRLLQQAGFKSDVINARRETAPEDMHWVYALPQIIDGVHATVTDINGEPLSLMQAKLHLIRAHLGDRPYGRLIQAFISLNDNALDAHVPAVFDAMIADDLPAYEQATSAMTDAMRIHGLTFAPDQAVAEIMQRRYQRLTAIAGQPEPSYCEVFGGNSTFDSPEQVAATNAFFDDIAFTAQAISSSKGRKVSKAHRPESFSPRDFIGDVYDKHVRQFGYSADYEAWTNTQRCIFIGGLYKAASTLRVSQQAAIVRAADGVTEYRN